MTSDTLGAAGLLAATRGPQISQEQLIFFGCLIVAVILHEISHGVVALAFGDDTAKRAGRLTLNPLPHIDPFGSVILPALAVLAHAPVLGWAKPVPVSPSRLRKPRRQMLYVGLAGPLTNFGLMALSAVAARAVLGGHVPRFCGGGFGNAGLAGEVLTGFALINLLLGIFNLLPIPPLDGSSLIERALPPSALASWHKFRPYGFVLLFALVFWSNVFGRILSPFEVRLCRYLVL